ncbi:MAG: menaquinone biosynthesis protein, partial [Planctomycetes bacterium]|nr:menaquinone biosynthesis protein [Planctomycetota bacterium]
VEFFRTPGYTIVSDACVACQGPVLSVKLLFRVPPGEVRRVALDEGSRTSSALTKVLLAEQCGVTPSWEPLPIGCGVDATDADCLLLIGDRAIVSGERGAGEIASDFCEVWDLGERWCRWTGLPFVFAMWIARPGVDTLAMRDVLNAARDQGVRQLAAIAAQEAAALDIDTDLARRYLQDNLHFKLGRKERQGLSRFYQLCVKHDLAPRGLDRVLEDCVTDGCRAF